MKAARSEISFKSWVILSIELAVNLKWLYFTFFSLSFYIMSSTQWNNAGRLNHHECNCPVEIFYLYVLVKAKEVDIFVVKFLSVVLFSKS